MICLLVVCREMDRDVRALGSIAAIRSGESGYQIASVFSQDLAVVLSSPAVIIPVDDGRMTSDAAAGTGRAGTGSR